jgi:GNAT superfamily N-acetyltransferase
VHEGARPAVEADRPILEGLYRAATAELAEERGGKVLAAVEHRGRTDPLVLGRDGEHVLAGTIDGAVVGYARIVERALEDGSTLAVLTDIYVEPGARGVGVGATLLEAAISWATERGCTGIDSLALPGMRASKNFFEAAGMVARLIVVHRALP